MLIITVIEYNREALIILDSLFRLRVVLLSLCPSCVTQEKTARKMTAQTPGGEKHAAMFSWWFTRSRSTRDYS